MPPLRSPLFGLLVTCALAAGSAASLSEAATRTADTPWALQQALASAAAAEPASPYVTQDRYVPAGGCFTLQISTGKLVTRVGSGFAATGAKGEPFRLQALDLGKYLLVGSRNDFLATAAAPAPTREAARLATGVVRGIGDERIAPVRNAAVSGLVAAAAVVEQATAPVEKQVRGDGIVAAAAPSASAEWVLKPFQSSFVLQQAFDDGQPENPGPVDPPISATLVHDASGKLSAAAGALTTPAASFSLVPTTGCAAWPEASVDVSGPVRQGATPYEQTKGYLDAHLHLMAFEFIGGRSRCGRPWHPYGITQALVDCPDHGPGGYGSLLEDVVSGKTPGTGHDPVGYPSFKSWPDNASLTHEQVYYRWLERAWRGGLRTFTALLVDNGQLCELYPLKKNSCDEMDGVRLQAVRLHELERYIDAQAGGPGRGWFRIVTNPLEARRGVNAGKLAVMMGIEVSRPLGCREYLGQYTCTAADIDKRLTEVHDLGVRQMEMTNKFDNALTGVTGDSGTTGLVVNGGNHNETGHFWPMETCQAPFGEVQHDKQQPNIVNDGKAEPARDAIFAAVLKLSGGSGATPIYPAGPHCSTIGLNPLGKVFLQGLVKRGMIFDPDHMSARARAEAIDILAKQGYSGVLSSHTWADDANYFKILTMGGIVTPHAGGSGSFIGKWAVLRTKADPRFLYGLGWGSDINGFSQQGAPRRPAPGKGVTYPFTGLGGVTVNKSRTGTRVWDVNTDGVDHYGQYVDWVEDARLQAGPSAAAFTRDVENGVEAFLQMWERATGVVGDSCRPDVPDLTKSDLKLVKKGMTPEQVMAILGQPHTRIGTSFGYCGSHGPAKVTFSNTGTVARVS